MPNPPLRPEYQKDAAARLEGVRSIAGVDKKVLFVGLHVRRTDYVQFSKQVLGKRVASKAYFQEAMDYFEEEYPDHSVYFLAVSDDLSWVRKHLGGRESLVIAGSHGSGEEDGLGEVRKGGNYCNSLLFFKGWQRLGLVGCLRPHHREPGPVWDLGRISGRWGCLLNLRSYGQGGAHLNLQRHTNSQNMKV